MPGKREFKLTRCHICTCTYERACPGGCSWVHIDGELPLCSTCQAFGRLLLEYSEEAHSVSAASLARLYELAKAGGAESVRRPPRRSRAG